MSLQWDQFKTVPEEAVQAGDYALWWSTPAEPLPSDSAAFAYADETMRCLHGIETYLLCRLARKFGLAELAEDTQRIALPDPDDGLEFYLRGPDGQQLALLASSEKGIRFLLHTEQTVREREQTCQQLLMLVRLVRNEVEEAALPFDTYTADCDPLAWWEALKERLTAEVAGAETDTPPITLLALHVSPEDGTSTHIDLPPTVPSKRLPLPPAPVQSSTPTQPRPPHALRPHATPKGRTPEATPAANRRREVPAAPPVAEEREKARKPRRAFPVWPVVAAGGIIGALLVGSIPVFFVVRLGMGLAERDGQATGNGEIAEDADAWDFIPGGREPDRGEDAAFGGENGGADASSRSDRADSDPTRPNQTSPTGESPSSSQAVTLGDPLLTFNLNKSIAYLAISRKGSLLVAGTREYAHVVDYQQKQRLRRFPAQAIAFSASGQRIACQLPGVQTINVWDVQTGQQISSHRFGSEHINGFQLDEVGSMLVVHSDRLRGYDLSSGDERWVLPEQIQVRAFAIRPAHDRVLVLTASRLQEYDLQSGRKMRELELDSQRGRLLTVSANGQHIAFVDGRHVIVYREWAELNRFMLEPGVTAIALNADGTRLASADGSHEVYLRDTSTGAVIQAATQPTTVSLLAFPPDGESLVVGGGNSVQRWRLVAGGRVLQPGSTPAEPRSTPAANGTDVETPDTMEDWAW